MSTTSVGDDLIKIMPSGGVLSTGDNPHLQLMSNEEIKAAIDAAHALGMKVAAHAQGKEAIDNSLRLGIDSIEHGTYADDASFARSNSTAPGWCPPLWSPWRRSTAPMPARHRPTRPSRCGRRFCSRTRWWPPRIKPA